MLSARAIEERAAYLSTQAKVMRRLEAAGLGAKWIVESGIKDGQRKVLAEILAPIDEDLLPELATKISDRVLQIALVEFAVARGLPELGALCAAAETEAENLITKQGGNHGDDGR